MVQIPSIYNFRQKIYETKFINKSLKLKMQQTFCSRTGETSCKCLKPKQPVNALQVDLKCAMRKLWSDHAVFDARVGQAIVDNAPDLPALLSRLKQNQIDIGNQFKQLKGAQIGTLITQALLNHIQTVGDFIKAKVEGNPDLLQFQEKMYDAGDELGLALSSINPQKLEVQPLTRLIFDHIQHIVAMGDERLSGNYENELRIYDSYYNELMELSDLLVNAL